MLRGVILVLGVMFMAVGPSACEKARLPEGGTAAQARGPVRFEPAPADGDVAAYVAARKQALEAEGRRPLVYVGADWCEPCKAFHAAAERGELDAALPGLTLLEFDADRDGARLDAAGYASELIPLFARPAPDGRASGKAIEGAAKGGDYVRELGPRVEALLAQ